MDEILHTPREESSAIRPPLAQLRDRWEAGTAAGWTPPLRAAAG